MLLHPRSGYHLREEPCLWLADGVEPFMGLRPVSRLAIFLMEAVMF